MWKFIKKTLSGFAGFVSGIIAMPLSISSVNYAPYRFFDAFGRTKNVTSRYIGDIGGTIVGAFTGMIYAIASPIIEGAITGYKHGFKRGVIMPWKVAIGFNPRRALLTDTQLERPIEEARTQRNRAQQQAILDSINRQAAARINNSQIRDLMQTVSAQIASSETERQRLDSRPSVAGRFHPTPTRSSPRSGFSGNSMRLGRN